MVISETERRLIGNTDARVWAREFVVTAQGHPGITTDEGTTLGWFANAIMAGYDEGQRTQRRLGLHAVVRELAFQAAGAGSGAVMARAPTVVMPSEEITVMVNEILDKFGIEGY